MPNPMPDHPGATTRLKPRNRYTPPPGKSERFWARKSGAETGRIAANAISRLDAILDAIQPAPCSDT